MNEPTAPNPDPVPANHLAHIREQVALLVARLEASPDRSGQPARDDEALALAHLLLRRITGAEQAIANDAESAKALSRIDRRYRESIARIDRLQDRLEHTPRARAPEPDEHPPSSGSTIGDAVRDGFLHMG